MRLLLILMITLSILVNGLSASVAFIPSVNEDLLAALEQQSLVKCLSVFSDISLQLAHKWFVIEQTRRTPANANKSKQGKRTDNTSKEATLATTFESRVLKAYRLTGMETGQLLLYSHDTLCGISVIARYCRYRRNSDALVLMLLLLMTFRARSSLGEYAVQISRHTIKTRSPFWESGFSFASRSCSWLHKEK